MSAVKKLLHTRYRVNDLEKTVRFYVDVLGLQEVRRHKSPRGSELAFLKAPGSPEEIEICHLPGSESVHVQPDLTHLAGLLGKRFMLAHQPRVRSNSRMKSTSASTPSSGNAL